MDKSLTYFYSTTTKKKTILKKQWSRHHSKKLRHTSYWKMIKKLKWVNNEKVKTFNSNSKRRGEKPQERRSFELTIEKIEKEFGRAEKSHMYERKCEKHAKNELSI